MKTTLEIPDHLMKQVKQRALQQGRPIQELVADYIRQGLHGMPQAPPQAGARVVEVDGAGMPLLRPDPGFRGRPIDLAEALELEQEALKQEDRQRDGLSSWCDYLASGCVYGPSSPWELHLPTL